MDRRATAAPARPAAPVGLPRLLPPSSAPPSSVPVTLSRHLARYGPLPPPLAPTDLIAMVARSGLRGRGGAGFPTARKLAAVAAGRRAGVVVANGTEGEPASGKDRILLSLAPHLVLDGAAVAAGAVGAQEVVVCVDRAAPTAHQAVVAALAERRTAATDGLAMRVEASPTHYVAGEETALVRWLNGGEAKPTFVPPRPFERGVAGRPTLVDNVETLAHLGLIARFGDRWYRGIGTPDAPGSMLVTVSGAVASAGVVEAACGTSLGDLLAAAGGPTGSLTALLVGGYYGRWIGVDAALTRPLDTSVGAGVLVALPAAVCGLVETARVARWLAGESAGQCGPCVHGLPAIAGGVEAPDGGVPDGGVPDDRVLGDLYRWLGLVRHRGGCHLPDGAANLVTSGLEVFAGEIVAHRAGFCRAPDRRPFLPLPATGPWR